MSKIVNMTPHAISVCGENGEVDFVCPPSGNIARVSVTRVKVDVVDNGESEGVPVYISKYGDVIGLPPIDPGTIYIVSAMVRQAMPDRTDIYSPGELIRDNNGQPIGCRGLERNF